MRAPHRSGLVFAPPAAALLAFGLGACAPAVELDPAPSASDPECARVLQAMPDEVAGASSRDTTSQASRAWGSPSAITVRCGVTPPGPTTDRCLPIETGDVTIDWIMTELGSADVDENSWKFTTFGRTPALEVVVPVAYAGEDVSQVLGVLGPAIAEIPATRECL